VTHHLIPTSFEVESYKDRIELAIATLESQAHPNSKKTAEIYKIERNTLAKRYRGEKGTKKAISNSSTHLQACKRIILISHYLEIAGTPQD
jgi:hypothetical protein